MKPFIRPTLCSVFSLICGLALQPAPASAAAASPAPQNGASIGNVSIGGTVPVVCTITYSQNANALSLNLYNGEPNGIQIGTVLEWCNSPNFTVTLTSSNRGLKLSNGSGAVSATTSVYAYDMGYAAAPATVYGSSIDEKLDVRRAGPQFDVEVPVMMRFNAMTRVVTGSYSDVLTISVKAN